MSEINKKLWENKGRDGYVYEKVFRKFLQRRLYWSKGYGFFWFCFIWYLELSLIINRFFING